MQRGSVKKEDKMINKKQIEQCLDILITRIDTINERTKKHTIEIKKLEKQIKNRKKIFPEDD